MYLYVFTYLIVLLIFFKKISKYIIYIFIISIIYNYSCVHNYNYINYLNNSTLINGILLIHPWCIYLTYNLLIINYLMSDNILSNLKKNTYTNKFRMLITCFTAIYLGGFWAQQELNWGGWWNWDYVELIALVFFIFILIDIHNVGGGVTIHLLSKNIFYYLLLFFVLVRCDILASIHSFNTFSTLDKYQLYIFASLSILFISVFFWKKMQKSFFFQKICKYNNPHYYFILIQLIVTFFIMYNMVESILINSQDLNISNLIKFVFLLLYIYFVIIICKNQHINMLYFGTILLIYKKIFLFFIFILLNLYILNLKKHNLKTHLLSLFFIYLTIFTDMQISNLINTAHNLINYSHIFDNFSEITFFYKTNIVLYEFQYFNINSVSNAINLGVNNINPYGIMYIFDKNNLFVLNKIILWLVVLISYWLVAYFYKIHKITHKSDIV